LHVVVEDSDFSSGIILARRSYWAKAAGCRKELAMDATNERPALSDDTFREMLGLMRKSDSVELKLTVPADDHRATINALKLDPLRAQIRQVYFLDTPDLRLNAAGVVARVRRVQGKMADSVVKLRPLGARQDPLQPEEVARLRHRG
jgi:hypothetical protein